MVRENKWAMPQEVDRVTVTFPAIVIGTLMPEMHEIPRAFRTDTAASAPWYRFQRQWFAVGLDDMKGAILSDELIRQLIEDSEVASSLAVAESTAQGLIDKAFVHLGTLQRSYEPKHEHKQAAVAWLASLWFSEIVWEKKPTADYPLVDGANS